MNEERGPLARLRTVLVVTLISAMLWLLAESRMVRTSELEAQVTMIKSQASGGIELVVRQSPDEPQLRTIKVELEGSTSGIDRFARAMQNRFELQLGREIPARPGVFTIDLRAELRRSADLDIHGITIKSVVPESVMIEVDEIETRDLPVRVIVPDGVQTDGTPRAEPLQVRVRAPATILSDLEAQHAQVELSENQLNALTPGRLETIPGAIVRIDGLDSGSWATNITPSQVDVLVTLKSITQQLTLDALPVQVLIAPEEISDWRVEIDDSDRDLVGVVVEGPVEAIEALRNGSIRPRAYISLSFEDLGRGVRSKPAQIMNLPKGCRVVGSEKTVGISITRTPSTDASGSGTDTPTP